MSESDNIDSVPSGVTAMRERALIAGAIHTLKTAEMPESLARARMKFGSTLARIAGRSMASADGWDARYWWVDDLLMEDISWRNDAIEVSGYMIWGDNSSAQRMEPFQCIAGAAGGDLTTLQFSVGDAEAEWGEMPYSRKRPRRFRLPSSWRFSFELQGEQRSLSRNEQDALEFMLSSSEPGVERLRQQALNAVVSGMCPCGCPTFDLAVPREDSELRSPFGSGLVLESTTDTDPPYELLVFCDEGWLSSLELVSYEPTPPTQFPDIGMLSPPRLIQWSAAVPDETTEVR